MVRVFIKGGVWKNSEDEILKAAVMKYGKQQWARVASLLNRKSAKQCKARWHEWLDPSVKKVEWSRQEEEKLLHLAKLMPAQWKTIGPLVGRTSTQCQEHYERLLDEATSAGDGSAARQDATALQAGQIDSHPETKPARPDPIDMDEDEMEMLQEARARLANTQGKKAKRKAREKMLAQAKRLADLQKRRELKQAGLVTAKRKRYNNKEIDLGAEIPFHKTAPAGFHDTGSEDTQAEQQRRQRLKAVSFQKINENQYKSRDREAKNAERREEARIRNLERSNMQYVVAQVSKTNDPLQVQKRGVLNLPAPQVSTKELGQLAKLQQQQQQQAEDDAAMEGSGATQALLGDYSDRPLPTPMRTPMGAGGKTPATHETLMREASQLRRLESGQTPLLGAAAVPGFKTTGLDDDEEDAEGMGVDRTKEEGGSADDMQAQRALSSSTPRLAHSGNQTPMSVAPRDQLGLNDENADDGQSFVSSFRSIRDLAREERRAAKKARKELEDALAALPAPQFEYDLAAPQDLPDDEDDAMQVETVKDAADEDAEEQERRRMEAEKAYEARSSVVKRKDLPRPAGAIPDFQPDPTSDPLEELIREEMWRLLQHDAHAFPVPVVDAASGDGKKKNKKRKKMDIPPAAPLEVIHEDLLDQAKTILEEETKRIVEEKLSKAMESGLFQSKHEALDAMVAANVALTVAETEHDTQKETIDSLKKCFAQLQEATAVLRKKNDKTESKIGVKNGGYAKRQKTVSSSIADDFGAAQNHIIEKAVFRQLQFQELRGADQRIEKLEEELAELEKDESGLQQAYGDLLIEKKRLAASLRQSA